MSRIGNKKITVPKNVNVSLDGDKLKIKGPKGELSRIMEPIIGIQVEGEILTVNTNEKSNFADSLHGSVRNEIANMVNGVLLGHEKKIEITGVGYKAQLQGKTIVLNIGFSHPVNVELPAGIEVSIEKMTNITVKGIDKYLVGQVAANIRSIKKAEPYKGRGIKYSNEKIIRKEGKTGKK